MSDFYLPEKAYRFFLGKNGIENLFDRIFISETCQASKKSGSLYKYVLAKLGVDPKQCVMIGDQKIDDVINAKKYGIKGIRYFPFRHKVFTNCARVFNRNYSRVIVTKMGKRLRKHSLFEDYVLSLFLFEELLVHELDKENISEISFFSRGGYLLKSFFDIYNYFNYNTETKYHYCYISRRAVFAAEKKNTESNVLLRDYIQTFIHKGQFAFVDEGWYCHSQQKLTEIFHLPTKGFYLGIRGRDDIHENNICYRKGLLFDIGNNVIKLSKYYGIFCANCSLYEQMLTAPEGSVIGYERKNNGIYPILKYKEIEKSAYNKCIYDWQQHRELSFKGLCAWLIGKQIDKRQVARVILKTDLYNSYERCVFLNKMDASMVYNY